MRYPIIATMMVSALALGTAANAQQIQTQDDRMQQPQMQQRAQDQQQQDQQQLGQQQPSVQVDQAPAQVQVEQQAPEIIVRQPAPQVTVQQPEPQVRVQQQPPEVQVQQAEPQVEVTRSGEPQVTIERQEQGQQQQLQPAEEDPQQLGQERVTTTTPTQQQFGLEELMDKDVIGQGGEEIGQVTDVLLDQQGQVRMIVVEHGGFLGIGSGEVAFDIEQVQLTDTGVQVPVTEEQISEMPQWDEEQAAQTGWTGTRTTTGGQDRTGTTN